MIIFIEKNVFKKFKNNKVKIICSFNDYLSWHCGNQGYVYWNGIFAFDGDRIVNLAEKDLLQKVYESYKDIASLITVDDTLYFSTDYNPQSEANKQVLLQVYPYGVFKNRWIDYTDRFNNEFVFMFLSNFNTITYDEYSLKYFINGASANIEPALLFLRCLEYDRDIYDLIRYGILNKNYT